MTDAAGLRATDRLRSRLLLVAVPAVTVLFGTAALFLYEETRVPQRFTQGISAYIFGFLGQFGIYLAVCYAIFHRKRDKTSWLDISVLVLVLGFSFLFRERLVTQTPYLSTDVFRYVWDGRVQASGINPYRYFPSAPELEHLRDDVIYPDINRRDYAQTIYPPVAQAIFLGSYLLAPSSVTAFKWIMIGFDGLAVLALVLSLIRLEMDPARVVVFAWHPLVVWEGAHTGHIESAAMAFISLAVLAWLSKKQVWTGVALACATLVKLYPALLLPIFLARQDADVESGAGGFRRVFSRLSIKSLIAFSAAIVLAYVPYLSVGKGVIGYLFGYFKEEGFVETGSRYFLLQVMRTVVNVPTEIYVAGAALSLIAFAAWALFKSKIGPAHAIKASAAIIGLFLFLGTPRYCWYLAWIIPFLCFVPRIAWFYMTGASVFLYMLWLTEDYPNIPIWLGAIIYVPTLALVLLRRPQQDTPFL